MQHLIRQVRRPASALRAVLVALATLAVTLACGEQDQLPTGPPIAAPAGPQATIVAANVTVLPTLGGTWTYAEDINESGQVVGYSYTPGNATHHAFLWTPGGGMRDLGTLGGRNSSASAINEAGQVVGWSDSNEPVGKGAVHAFLWTPGQGIQDLGTFGAQHAVALGINDNGQVVGARLVTSLWARAFLWTMGSGAEDLGSLGGWASAWAINNAGQVVGYSQTANGETHAVLWTTGRAIQDLGTLNGESTVASAINEAGQVVGYTWLGEERPRAFLWLPGEGMRDLGTLGGTSGEAHAINEAGQLVGNSTTVGGLVHAFVWTAADGMEDLYPATGMTDARAINDRGQVAGGDRVATLQFQVPNRDRNGAFTTGSGFYAVPGQGKRKAHFTFNVKVLPGRSTTPNGTAKFWIPGAQVAFESTAIEMLVASGNRAQFWGTGTLNGAAARFRITAVDGQPTGSARTADAFRIELWQAGTSVFDSQPGASQDAPVTTKIDAGSIQVHRPS